MSKSIVTNLTTPIVGVEPAMIILPKNPGWWAYHHVEFKISGSSGNSAQWSVVGQVHPDAEPQTLDVVNNSSTGTVIIPFIYTGSLYAIGAKFDTAPTTQGIDWIFKIKSWLQ